ncbi:Hypothetical predicted protein, partial [Pelobates cultripes]
MAAETTLSPLQHLPDPGNLPITQEILRACLDEVSDKLLNNIQASVTALSKDIQEQGERTAHVEHRMGEYAEAHNDLADHVQALEMQLTSLKCSDLEDGSRRQNLNAARDTLTHLHYYHVKEAILKAARNHKNLPPQYGQLQIYADLSAATLQRQRDFKEITGTLREHKIPYRWGHPVRLIIQRNGPCTHAITPEE